MQTRIETPSRPKPPAKVRRSLLKGSTTPPPAYASTFPFPSSADEIDGMAKTSTKVGNWDPAGEGNGELDDDLSWLNEKSRDELTDLLVKADVLIKERESGMSPQ